jgi:hypothetical protein
MTSSLTLPPLSTPRSMSSPLASPTAGKAFRRTPIDLCRDTAGAEQGPSLWVTTREGRPLLRCLAVGRDR